ncbi:AAA family ATPase [Micromonospora sp. NPDC005806]|uniref:AAA family ATPase n=1 Tax=Micromonospora sp. NPDC005806 TaxID=3364234 RepID=UPI00369E6B57
MPPTEVLRRALDALDEALLAACDREEARAVLLAGDGAPGWAGVRNLIRPGYAALNPAGPTRPAGLLPASPGHPLHRLAAAIGLDETDLDVVLLLAAPHLEPRYRAAYAVLHDDLTQPAPTDRLVRAVLFADDRVAAGARLVRAGIVLPGAGDWPPLGRPLHLAGDIVALLRGDAEAPGGPLVAGTADIPGGAVEPRALLVVHGAGDRWGQARALLPAEHDLLAATSPGEPADALTAARAAWRIGAARGAVPVIDLDPLPDAAAAVVASELQRLVEEFGGRAWLLARRPLPLPIPHVEVARPDWDARRRAWLAAAVAAGLELDDEAAGALATRFRLGGPEIRRAVAAADPRAGVAGLRAAAATLGSTQVRHTTGRVPDRSFADVVLPDTTREALERLVFFLLHRDRVARRRGLATGLGVERGPVVLFSGRSGTGKTLSAEAVAQAVGRPLHTVNLAQLVSKYIGETEKHVDEVLDAAETASAVLFFDEADALFATRHEDASSAGEQFGNMLVGHLLQRIETHDGLVILATNLRHAIDEAFLRRFHFRIEFPLPGVRERAAIWDLLLPAERAGDVDLDELAREHRLAGGDIRNAALRAVFLAAARGEQVGHKDLDRAVALELLELGRLSRRRRDGEPADRGEVLRAFVDDLDAYLEEELRGRFLKEIHLVHGSPTDERLSGKRPAVSVAFFRIASRRGQGGLRAGFVLSAWSHVAEEEAELLGVVDDALARLRPAPVCGRTTTVRVSESNDFDLLHRFWSSHGHPVRPSLVLDVEIG